MWIYNGSEFTSDMIQPNYGFVYRITNLINNKQYIGRKYFYSKRTLPPLAGKTRKRIVISESDWKEYCGSSGDILYDIEQYGKSNFFKEIISLHPNKQETNYHEVKLQFMLDVLQSKDKFGNPQYYNKNILTKFYPSEKSREHRDIVHKQYVTICQ